MLLTVQDSGCGMTEQQIARILQPEAASPGEAVESPGQRQGVGLRVVQELVAASGGRLTITSRVGVGTQIEIRWPVAEGEMVERMEDASGSLAAVSRADASTRAHWKSKLQAEAARRVAATAVPGILPRIAMVADPQEWGSQGSFAEAAGVGVEGGAREAERRRLLEPHREERKAVSGTTEFQRFKHDSKGAIAC